MGIDVGRGATGLAYLQEPGSGSREAHQGMHQGMVVINPEVDYWLVVSNICFNISPIVLPNGLVG